MKNLPVQWLLLVISLPTNGATARMRIWRALKTLGCGSLRDGAYLLPFNELHQQRLNDLLEETVREGGSGWLMTVQTQTEEEAASYRGLFDRSAECSEFSKALARACKALPKQTLQEISKTLRKQRRDYEALRAIDFFPNEASAQVESAWGDFVKAAEAALSPDEPHATDAQILLLDSKGYQGRTWATRQHLWVDRVASAWLIQRFIDPKAKFLWLKSSADCPAKALGFDFDGAAFTHAGNRVTFEVLMASFNLEHDAGLLHIAAIVHALDVGEGFVPEASGFEAILSGVRQSTTGDDQLLKDFGQVLDALYMHFSTNP
jgi:hypothetical protein